MSAELGSNTQVLFKLKKSAKLICAVTLQFTNYFGIFNSMLLTRKCYPDNLKIHDFSNFLKTYYF